jgi:hypothetical protein
MPSSEERLSLPQSDLKKLQADRWDPLAEPSDFSLSQEVLELDPKDFGCFLTPIAFNPLGACPF